MQFQFADCILDVDSRTLARAGETVAVEPQVFDLLLLLARNPDRVVTRDEMIEAVWGGRIVSESAISARIAAARKAVGDDGKRQAVIRTVARRGLQMASEVHRVGEPPANAPETQRIRYTTNARGQSLAYSVMGQGPPLVRAGYNLTHLEEEWLVPTERAFFEALAEHFTLIRFDIAGTGLSEPAPVEIDFEAMAADIVTVARAAGHARFSLYSESGGALSAVRAAALHPEAVSRLVIKGGYVDGRTRRDPQVHPDAIRAMFAEGWREPGSGFVAAYLLSYFPEGPLQAVQDFARITQASCPRDQALRIRDASNADSIAVYLPRVQCPTLILHARHDGVHPLSEAQKLAAGIPDAELVVLETANLTPIHGQPEWPRMVRTMLDFLPG